MSVNDSYLSKHQSFDIDHSNDPRSWIRLVAVIKERSQEGLFAKRSFTHR